MIRLLLSSVDVCFTARPMPHNSLQLAAAASRAALSVCFTLFPDMHCFGMQQKKVRRLTCCCVSGMMTVLSTGSTSSGDSSQAFRVYAHPTSPSSLASSVQYDSRRPDLFTSLSAASVAVYSSLKYADCRTRVINWSEHCDCAAW